MLSVLVSRFLAWTTGEAHLLEISELKLPQACEKMWNGVPKHFLLLRQETRFIVVTREELGKEPDCHARCLRCLRQIIDTHQSKLSVDILAVKHRVNS